MIRTPCVLALALMSCGVDPDQQGDTGGAAVTKRSGGRAFFNIDNGTFSGSFEDMPAKSLVDELLKKFSGDLGPGVNISGLWESLRGYEVTNKLTDSPGERFTFKFEKLKTPADLKELLERELKATVTLDEKAKTFTVE